MSAYPPVAFPPRPPTSNSLTAQQRSALVRSSKKLSKILGDVPRVVDDDVQPPSVPLPVPTESTWHRRKAAHLPPPLKLSSTPNDDPDAPDSPTSLTSSVAPLITSNRASTSCESSFPDPSLIDASQRRAKLERVRHKLGLDVPATAVFPHTPKTSELPTPHARTRSVARLPNQSDDVRSVTFSISSDESTHSVTFTSARVHPHRRKHVYQTGPLPPVPPIPPHLVSASTSSSRRAADDDDAGLIRPRQKMAAGSKFGGSDFKAARRAKREGRPLHGTAEPGEMVEMVGFMW